MTDRATWDEVWMANAVKVGERSRCSRGSIGCVLVGPDNQVVSTSYVGPPATYAPAEVDPSSDCRSWCERSLETDPAKLDAAYSNCPSVHAEQNAVSRADFTRLRGGTAYINASACWQCAKLLAASQVARVVMMVKDGDGHRNPQRTLDYFAECGIATTVLPG